MSVRPLTRALILLLGIGAMPTASAEDEVITIEGTRIRGNQELPTILYLLPWQPPEVRALESPDQSFAIHRPLQMLERQEFKRMIGYYEHFRSAGSSSTQGSEKD